MQAVSKFYEDSSDVIVHGIQHLLEIVKLLWHLVLVLLFLRNHSDKKCHILSKLLLYLLVSTRSVFYDIMQESCTNRCCSQLHLVSNNHRYCNRVYDVGFSWLACLITMCLSCKIESLLHQLHLFYWTSLLHCREDLVGAMLYLCLCYFVGFHFAKLGIFQFPTKFLLRNLIKN